jgi:ANTH domain
MLKYGDRTGAHHVLRLDNFSDQSSKETWDYSSWIRSYSIYLDERVDAYKHLKFDPMVDGTVGGCQAGYVLRHTEQHDLVLGSGSF